MTATVLVVEDDHDLREALCDTLSLAGYDTVSVEDGREALQSLSDNDVDLVISDVQMQHLDGHQLLKKIKSQTPDIPVLLMTAYGTIQSAVEAMRDGAIDYLVKPFESEVLVTRISQLLPGKTSESSVIAEDPAMRKVIDVARKVAATDATVMITGESGCGKEVMFRYIHDHSPRKNREPVAINCAAIPDNMLEAILFGYEKGAFTGAYKSSAGKFELAQGSTLLLDEVSEMSLGLQAKLLRVLQEKKVERLGGNKEIELDVRVLATSNRDLASYVADGKFREDLFYRLNVFPLQLPPLRTRLKDIVPLAEHLLEANSTAQNQPVPRLDSSAQQALLQHNWPGNVRELDNVIQRALIIHSGDVISAGDLYFESASSCPAVTATVELAGTAQADEGMDYLGDDLKARERQLIIDALNEGNGSRKYAADKLGISARTLRYKIARMREDGLAVPGR